MVNIVIAARNFLVAITSVLMALMAKVAEVAEVKVAATVETLRTKVNLLNKFVLIIFWRGSAASPRRAIAREP
jgi:type IV secretory pathway VirB3-like protein